MANKLLNKSGGEENVLLPKMSNVWLNFSVWEILCVHCMLLRVRWLCVRGYG